MSKAELGITTSNIQPGIENSGWEPALTLRPHHATFETRTNRAILGEEDEPAALYYSVAFLGQLFGSGSFIDEFGNSITGIYRTRKSENRFITKLRQMPDDTIVQLDLTPDEVCKSCQIGKHCTATNYKAEFGIIGDIPEIDGEEILSIKSSLEDKGYIEGEDYIFKKTTHTIYNYGGKKLNEVDNPTPETVEFDSMLLKLGTLREAIQHIK